MEHRIQYLKDENGHYVGCIAIQEHPENHDEDRYLVEYRVSALNPADKFDKDVGRQLAIGRMVEAPYCVYVARQPSMHGVSIVIMRDIARDSTLPSRVRRAAKFWLRKSGRR